MRDLMAELRQLRLHGMAQAWSELLDQDASSAEGARWLLEHLLAAEAGDRAMRSVNYQLHAAKFPVHRDLVGFDFDVSPVDRALVTKLATAEFIEPAHNVVFVGGTEYAT